MSRVEAGRAWRFGDDIDTDALTPAKYVVKNDPEYWAAHVLENVRPEFAGAVKKGDVVVAGHSFGSGSSREHSAIALRTTGIQAVIAESFARTFYRNAFNNGLLVVEVPGVLESMDDGDLVSLDIPAGTVTNVTKDASLRFKRVPNFLLAMHEVGGLIPWLKSTGGAWRLTGGEPPRAADDHSEQETTR